MEKGPLTVVINPHLKKRLLTKESMKFYGDFMKRYRLSVVVEKDADGYFVFCPELQGCYSKGDTYKEALETIKDAIRFHISCISISGSSMN